MISAPYGDASSSKSECQRRGIHPDHKKYQRSLQESQDNPEILLVMAAGACWIIQRGFALM